MRRSSSSNSIAGMRSFPIGSINTAAPKAARGTTMTTDLRDVPADEYWQRFNAMVNGDGGLLTYRYLGRKTAMLHGRPHDTMRSRRDMRSSSGASMAAPLAIASAEAGGFSDVDSIPAPVPAALHIIDDGLGVTEIAMRRTPIHVG